MKINSGDKNTLLLLLLPMLVGLSACVKNDTRDESGVASSDALPAIEICAVPNPKVPSSAFEIFQSRPLAKTGYWVRYQCKQSCEDWRKCLVPAYSNDNGRLLMNGRQPRQAKMALAITVDGLGGHLALSEDGDKTVFIHTGAGGTRYYIKPAFALEQNSSARTVTMRWEKGYIAPIVQAPFTQPLSLGWFSRTSEKATNIKELNKRIASIMAWVHDNISDSKMYGTLACSMGTNATFGPVLWHGLDSIIDYQLFVGGPNMWDLNAQCARRSYSEGYCDIDGVSSCKNDSDCAGSGDGATCVKPQEYTTIDQLFEQIPNHLHATDACDISAADESTPAYAPFDSSSMAFADGADWEIDHPMDFVVNLGLEQGDTRAELGGDEYWALGHFPPVYNKIKPEANKRWHAYPDTNHCDAMFDEALTIIKERMDL